MPENGALITHSAAMLHQSYQKGRKVGSMSANKYEYKSITIRLSHGCAQPAPSRNFLLLTHGFPVLISTLHCGTSKLPKRNKISNFLIFQSRITTLQNIPSCSIPQKYFLWRMHIKICLHYNNVYSKRHVIFLTHNNLIIVNVMKVRYLLF